MARKEQSSWTDNEQNLFTLDYKTEKIANGIDWESIRDKYGDIWERFSATGGSHWRKYSSWFPPQALENNKSNALFKAKRWAQPDYLYGAYVKLTPYYIAL